MKDVIIDTLRMNPSLSYENLAEKINNFCSSSTIQSWMASHVGYSIYTQCMLPLLSKEQRMKHVQFAKHLLDNWGSPRQKILWIHYDEKWWFGHVNRGNCKKLEQLGLEKTHTYAYHKNYI